VLALSKITCKCDCLFSFQGSISLLYKTDVLQRYCVVSDIIPNKKYVLSNSESVQCNFFIFDHVTFIQFKICCCMQNFMKIRWFFFTAIWRYIDFQMAADRHLGIVLSPYETTHKVCCWPQLPVKFHVISIWSNRLEMPIWIFRIFGLKCLFRPPKWGFRGLWTTKCDYSPSRPQKSHSCVNPRLLSR